MNIGITKQTKTIYGSGQIYYLGIHEDTTGYKLWSYSSHFNIKRRDLNTGIPIRTFTGHSDDINGILVDGNTLWSWSLDTTICRWDIASGQRLHVYTGHTDQVNHVVIDGDAIWSCSDDHWIRKWDMDTGNQLLAIRDHDQPVNQLRLYGDTIWSCSDDHSIRQYDTATGQPIKYISYKYMCSQIHIHDEKIYAVEVGIGAGFIHSYHMYNCMLRNAFLDHDSWIKTVIFYDVMMWTLSGDGTIIQWHTHHRDGLMKKITGCKDRVKNIVLFNDAIWGFSSDGMVRRWGAFTGKLLSSEVSEIGKADNVAAMDDFLWASFPNGDLVRFTVNALADIKNNYWRFTSAERRHICEVMFFLERFICADLICDVLSHLEDTDPFLWE